MSKTKVSTLGIVAAIAIAAVLVYWGYLTSWSFSGLLGLDLPVNFVVIGLLAFVAIVLVIPSEVAKTVKRVGKR